MDSLVVPGTKLNQQATSSGNGVYDLNGELYASLVGKVEVQNGVVSVQPYPENACRSVVPSVDDTIIGTVTKITAKYAAVDIRAIERTSGSIRLPEPFRGTVRVQDVFPPEEKETAQIPLCFLPGDLVRAQVIGVGDASAGFLLTTGASPRLGVVFARSAGAGEPLVPVSWNTMICAKTGIKEPRKCARPE